jgi:hypothetical protein
MTREAFREKGLDSLFGAARGLSASARQEYPVEEEVVGSSPSISRSRTEQSILQALKETFVEAGVPGWDGYNASPVTAAAVSYALQFLLDLPSDVATPDIDADADGNVALDWDYGPRNVFSVRISRDGTLYYAGLFGHSTYHGSEALRRGIPKTVAEGIVRAIRESQLRH